MGSPRLVVALLLSLTISTRQSESDSGFDAEIFNFNELPFNDANIKEPTTPTGPALSEKEFSRAKQIPVKIPERLDIPWDSAPVTRNYFSFTFSRWPNQRVPYTIDETFDKHQRLVIAQAMLEIEANSCVKFHPKTGADQDFVHIHSGELPTCWADDHYQRGKGQHEIYLHRKYCVYKHVVVHEMLHLLGVGHEQQRPDRDEHVTIHWDNIDSKHAFNFFKDIWDTEPTQSVKQCSNWRELDNWADCHSGVIRKGFNIGYDHKSIMHYESNFFAKDSSKPTITSNDPTIDSLGGYEMTDKDKMKLQAAYGCLGQEYSGCGGSIFGESGEITGAFDIGCEWFVAVDDSFVIELEFEKFQIPDCSEANITLFSGFKELNHVLGTFCGSQTPPSVVTTPQNALTILYQKATGSSSNFRIQWKKTEVSCCKYYLVSAPKDSKVYERFSDYFGLYGQVGKDDIRDAPLYRMFGNLNVWMGRFLPMRRFSVASWTVAHELKSGSPYGTPKQSGEFYLGSNVRCPHLITTIFYQEQGNGPYINNSDISISCVTRAAIQEAGFSRK